MQACAVQEAQRIVKCYKQNKQAFTSLLITFGTCCAGSFAPDDTSCAALLELGDPSLQYVLLHDYFAIVWGLHWEQVRAGKVAGAEDIPLIKAIKDFPLPDSQDAGWA